MTIHAMIDLETLSTRPDAVILSLGGIKFDPYTQNQPHDPLYFKVDVDSQTNMGRHVMQETLDWWATQPEKIQEDALGEQDRISLEECVRSINKWSVGVDVFWCQGPLFDYAILQNLYAQLEKPVPWQYWSIRDSRTLFSLFREQEVAKQDAHNALADCDYQAKKVQRYYKALGLKP
jgi:exodeoxyribonuclease VIII